MYKPKPYREQIRDLFIDVQLDPKEQEFLDHILSLRGITHGQGLGLVELAMKYNKE